MPEQNTVRYSAWVDEKERFDTCYSCQKKGKYYQGALMRRRIFERDGSIHAEYTVMCLGCKKHTMPHRSKLIAIKEWEGKNQPGDGLKYRSRTPNIALNREAGILKGDDSNGLK